MLTYKDKVVELGRLRSDIELRLWHIINIAENLQETNTVSDEEVSCLTQLYPSTHTHDWSIDITYNLNGVEAYFSRYEPYEDWEESATVKFNWELMCSSDNEAQELLSRTARKLYKEDKLRALNDLRHQATNMGYTLCKVEV